MRNKNGLSKISYIVIIFIIIVAIFLIISNINSDSNESSNANIMNEANRVVYRETSPGEVQAVDENSIDNAIMIDSNDVVILDDSSTIEESIDYTEE